MQDSLILHSFQKLKIMVEFFWRLILSETNYLDLFSKGCKYLNLRDACISGSLNLRDLSSQSDDTKDMVKKPFRPLVFCGPPGVDISSIIKGKVINIGSDAFSNPIFQKFLKN